eukprot:1595444-Rhodomonas_salina.1
MLCSILDERSASGLSSKPSDHVPKLVPVARATNHLTGGHFGGFAPQPEMIGNDRTAVSIAKSTLDFDLAISKSGGAISSFAGVRKRFHTGGIRHWVEKCGVG